MIEIFTPNGGRALALRPQPGASRGRRDPGPAREAPGGYGPIIGVTLNRARSRPNWYITSATRWILTLSMAVG
jgi:hypothetical protein